MSFEGIEKNQIDHQAAEAGALTLARLQSLADLASVRPANADLAARVTSEAISVLGAQLCIIQRFSATGDWETAAISRGIECQEAWVERITAHMSSELRARQRTLNVGELSNYLRQEELPIDARINSYLGMPLSDREGKFVGITSLFSERTTRFPLADELWLTAATRFISEALMLDRDRSDVSEIHPALVPALAAAEQFASGGVQEIQKSRGNVLVIDDDRSFNHVICNFLKDEGYYAEAAFDGLEAMQVFRPHAFDVVMTDVAMPNMNGWELIAALRIREPRIPIVLMTAYQSGMWSEHQLRKSGVATVLNKPFPLERLLSVLEELTRLTNGEA